MLWAGIGCTVLACLLLAWNDAVSNRKPYVHPWILEREQLTAAAAATGERKPQGDVLSIPSPSLVRLVLGMRNLVKYRKLLLD